MTPRTLLGAGFAALSRWRLILLLAGTAAALGGLAASPLAPAMRDDLARTLAGDRLLGNDPAQAPVDALDFFRENSAVIAGWGRASLWAALASLLLQLFFTGGIVETLGRADRQGPEAFWAASRRHFAHNAKCFALTALALFVAVGGWLATSGAVSRALFEGTPPHSAGRTAWRTATIAIALLLAGFVLLLAGFARAARRWSPRVGSIAAFRDARRRLRGHWLRGVGLQALWAVLGAAALAIVLAAAWYQRTPTGLSVFVNLLLLALSLVVIPAARVGAWGSLLALYDRSEEKSRAPLRQLQAIAEAPAAPELEGLA